MGKYFVANQTMVTIECCNCHILFAVPEEFNDQQLKLREEGIFYCPKGHYQHYVGLSKEEKLKHQLSNAQSCCVEFEQKTAQLERKTIALRGHLTRKKKLLEEIRG